MSQLATIPSNWTWQHGPIRGGPAVIVDMDGVISDARHRQHLLRSNLWDEFFNRCGDDPPLVPAMALLASIAPNLAVVLLTARPIRVRDSTLGWLLKHQVRWDLLIMSPPADTGTPSAFKSAEVANLRGHGFELLYALEDDPRNVAIYTEAGVPCVYIHSGYYDR
ncbi:MAG: hypothetical protein OXF21_03430 [bacterium]|nr:hypothetical protein [bacterium]